MSHELTKAISEGFTPRIRVIIAVMIGSIGALFAIGIFLAPTHWQVYLAPLFCFLIAGFCLAKDRLGQFLGSCLGVYVFIFTCWYVYDQFVTGQMLPAYKGDQSILGSLLALAVFGVPGLIYAWKAKFGFKRQVPKS